MIKIAKLSRPARALWIEIYSNYENEYREPRSRPARALWIEIGAFVP